MNEFVSMVTCRDRLYALTKRGVLYEIGVDPYSGLPKEVKYVLELPSQ